MIKLWFIFILLCWDFIKICSYYLIYVCLFLIIPVSHLISW